MEYKMYENGWGNNIIWMFPEEFDKWDGSEDTLFTATGHKRRRPKVGDTLVGEFTESFITFEFVEVKLYSNPRDMFMAKVKPISQEDKKDPS